eukprot:GFUD01038116.1.p1 GENE.GFUD01038116.1~~GFUD01038116.1.p1  ORF type:complete len:281 (-),score=69.03 GFUD01038116.1:63-905(-)
MSASNFKCLLCHEIVDLVSEDDKHFANHMLDIHGALFDLNLLLAVHFITPDEKISVIKRTEKKISEHRTKIEEHSEETRIKAVPSKLMCDVEEQLNSSLALIKASVFDKIKIFENKGVLSSSQVSENHKGLDYFSKQLKPVKTVVNVLVKQTKEQSVDDAEDNYADDTINVFDEILADCTLNLDLTVDPFDILLEDNKIFSENCLDVTISDITRVDNEIRDTNSQPGYKCGKCGEAFNFFAHFKKHILAKRCRLSSTERPRGKCDVCRSMNCKLKAHIKC